MGIENCRVLGTESVRGGGSDGGPGEGSPRSGVRRGGAPRQPQCMTLGRLAPLYYALRHRPRCPRLAAPTVRRRRTAHFPRGLGEFVPTHFKCGFPGKAPPHSGEGLRPQIVQICSCQIRAPPACTLLGCYLVTYATARPWPPEAEIIDSTRPAESSRLDRLPKRLQALCNSLRMLFPARLVRQQLKLTRGRILQD